MNAKLTNDQLAEKVDREIRTAIMNYLRKKLGIRFFFPGQTRIESRTRTNIYKISSSIVLRYEFQKRNLHAILYIEEGRKPELDVAEWYEFRWVPILAEALPEVTIGYLSD